MNYTNEQLQQAFEDWANQNPLSDERKVKWHHYCDIRDRLPAGTSHARSLIREKEIQPKGH